MNITSVVTTRLQQLSSGVGVLTLPRPLPNRSQIKAFYYFFECSIWSLVTSTLGFLRRKKRETFLALMWPKPSCEAFSSRLPYRHTGNSMWSECPFKNASLHLLMLWNRVSTDELARKLPLTSILIFRLNSHLKHTDCDAQIRHYLDSEKVKGCEVRPLRREWLQINFSCSSWWFDDADRGTIRILSKGKTPIWNESCYSCIFFWKSETLFNLQEGRNSSDSVRRANVETYGPVLGVSPLVSGVQKQTLSKFTSLMSILISLASWTSDLYSSFFTKDSDSFEAVILSTSWSESLPSSISTWCFILFQYRLRHQRIQGQCIFPGIYPPQKSTSNHMRSAGYLRNKPFEGRPVSWMKSRCHLELQ